MRPPSMRTLQKQLSRAKKFTQITHQPTQPMSVPQPHPPPLPRTRKPLKSLKATVMPSITQGSSVWITRTAPILINVSSVRGPTALSSCAGTHPPQNPIRTSSSYQVSLPMPVRSDVLFAMLQGYDAIETDYYLCHGFSYSFSMGYEGITLCHAVHNSKLVQQNPHIAQALIDKDCSLGRMAGPFPFKPFQHMQIFPINIREKRLIG